MDFDYLPIEQPPNTLYHYTSLQALVSIAKSKRIWASNIRFLNDRSESVWLEEHVISVLNRMSNRTGQRDRMMAIIAEIEALPRFSSFVASFTEKPDDLSQWRAYCPPSRGVSIGFSTACLSEKWVANPSDPERPSFLDARLQRARYYATINEDILEDVLERLLCVSGSPDIDPKRLLGFPPEMFPMFMDAIANATGRAEEAEHLKSVKTIPTWLSMMAPVFKHSAFKEEAEWRKIISKDRRLMPGQQFRQGEATLIPYVEVMLDARTDGANRVLQETYFIDEVIVGPTPTPELTIEAVQAIFATERKDVKVRSSDIPYRTW